MRSRLTAALLAVALLAVTAAPASAQGAGTTTVPPVPHQQVQPGTTPQPAPAPNPAPPASDQRIQQAAQNDHSSGPPAALVALAGAGALLLLALALWGAARWWAWEPSWAPRARHAAAEAGWRASLGWADFRDWLRLGR